jgi:oligopeptide transport system substrate-binding protein
MPPSRPTRPAGIGRYLRLSRPFAWFAGTLLLAALAGCAKRAPTPAPAAPSAPAAPAAPQILRVAQRNEPASLDPATTILPDEFGTLRTLLEGLLVPGFDGGAPRPGAAERFTVSADGLTYTFHLRPAALWSDGTPVTAEHFLAAYRRVLTPATAAPKANVFFSVKNARAFATGALSDFAAVGFRAPDAHTLVITLEQPNPRFPYYVASGPWLPVRTDLVAQHGRTWTRPEHYVGNGAFTLAEWRADQRIVVRKNPRWHDAARVRLDEIRFIRFDSGDSEDRAYRAGQIDVTMSVPFTKIAAHTAERPAELHRANLIDPRFLAFNTQRPPLDDYRVRLALALAIDRNKLVERVLQGGQLATGRLVPPSLRAATDTAPRPSTHRYDPAAARALLAAAGVTPESFPRLELSYWSGPAALEAIQAMWKTELGLNVLLARREARVHLTSLATGAYDISFINAIPDVADAANILADFTADSPENYPHWSSPAFDAALARGDTRAAETELLTAAPLTPLYFNNKIFLVSPRVQGWREDGLWSPDFTAVSLSL